MSTLIVPVGSVPVVPQQVPMWKFVLRLAQLNIDQQVETAYINTASPVNRRQTQVAFQRLLMMARDNPAMITALTAQGYSSAQIDDVFRTANALPDSPTQVA